MGSQAVEYNDIKRALMVGDYHVGFPLSDILAPFDINFPERIAPNVEHGPKDGVAMEYPSPLIPPKG